MRARLVRHVSASGRTRVLATSLGEKLASVGALSDLHHGRWRIEEVFKCSSTAWGLSQHALLVVVAAKVQADNLAALPNRAVPLPLPLPLPQAAPDGTRRQVNRSAAAKLLSRSIGSMLLVAAVSLKAFMTG